MTSNESATSACLLLRPQLVLDATPIGGRFDDPQGQAIELDATTPNCVQPISLDTAQGRLLAMSNTTPHDRRPAQIARDAAWLVTGRHELVHYSFEEPRLPHASNLGASPIARWSSESGKGARRHVLAKGATATRFTDLARSYWELLTAAQLVGLRPQLCILDKRKELE